VHARVADDALDGGGVEVGTVEHPARSPLLELLQVDHHVDVGPVAPGRGITLVVEEAPTDVHQGVGPALRRAAGGFSLDIGAGRLAQRRLQELASLGIEVAPQLPAAVHDARAVQRAGRLGRFRGIEQGLGLDPPVAHHRRRLGHRQGD